MITFRKGELLRAIFIPHGRERFHIEFALAVPNIPADWREPFLALATYCCQTVYRV
jgi:hypothetical protein